ncbi:MAG: hypothetical protein ACOYVF_05965 [Candidatus Zixiibacteriota bacterium]
MRKILTPLLLAVFLFIPAYATDVNLGVSLDNDGLKGFYLAIGEHYQALDKEIVAAKKSNIPNEDMPVIFFLARRANTTPEVIIKLRLDGKSWMDITGQFGLTAEIFYVPLKEVSGPPYGNAYGHFKHRNRKEWKEIRLTDPDIVNFVNLKFISEHYGCTPDEVVKMREKGSSFISINSEVKKNKAKKDAQPVAARETKEKPIKGKGKSK